MHWLWVSSAIAITHLIEMNHIHEKIENVTFFIQALDVAFLFTCDHNHNKNIMYFLITTTEFSRDNQMFVIEL